MKKISFINITKKFRQNFWEKEHFALKSVNFSIHEGDLVGFLGANGAGKTTSIKILLGLIKEDEGSLIFEGFTKNTREAFIEKLGYLPEKTYLYQHLTGREFLHYISSIFNLSKIDTNQLVRFWSERLTIDHALDRKISTYSKGMQQRLCFVSALLNRPEVLILDEPLSGLDPLGRRDFKEVFKELNRENGTTVFFSSHVVSDVEEICNKVLFIEKGKIIYEGAIDTLIHENENDLYKIKYFEGKELKVEYINELVKDIKINELINNRNINLVELEKSKPSLENIIYKIKTNE